MKTLYRTILMSLLLISSARAGSGMPTDLTVYTTADSSSLRLTRQGTVPFAPSVQPLETEICVFVNPSNLFQTFLGIGGALTDASAEVYAKLSPAKQKEFMTAYYDKENGIGYTLGRTSIHSCDFSSASFTYVKEGDKELRSFSIDHDRKFRLPFIKSAIAAAGGQLMMYASPWSPPAFMKSNKNMLQGGKLLPEYYQSWALYYTKFIKA
ncbi:MAG: glycosyl hydrolase, partial [Bacteroidetes bacterium]|nr:glycosyl hydrolase [Bacteroidota bacterium]